VEEASSSSPDDPVEPVPKRPRAKARDFALRRLTRRAHSEGELTRKMARAGYPVEEIVETIDFLRKRRYLDDVAFARDFARERAERRRWGPARIETALKALALADQHIKAALAEVFPFGEREAGERALLRFLSSERRALSPAKRQARAYRHLLARGFTAETAHELVSSRDFGDTEGLESTKN